MKSRLCLALLISALLFGLWSAVRLRQALLWPECFSSLPVMTPLPIGATYCVCDPAGNFALFVQPTFNFQGEQHE